MAAKVEVQVRHCFCCGLTPGTFLIGIYSLLLFSLLTGLAAWALSETEANGDKPIYEGCELEAQGKVDRRIKFNGDPTTVVIEDSSSYHCSFGIYTEEMKYAKEARYLALIIDLFLYVPLVLASLALLVGVCIGSPWLLVPWLVIMPFEILRGLISTILVFLMSHGLLARIATGIFFLGLQFLHISLWILVLAKFLRLRYRHHPAPPHYDSRQSFPPSQQPPYVGGGYYGPASYTYSPQSGRRVPIADEYGHHQQPQPHQQYRQPNPSYDAPARY